MHQPPTWVLAGSERLTLDGFNGAFSQLWKGLKRRFVKLECWQSYRELESAASQEAFEAGKVSQACHLLEQEAQHDRPLYEEVRARGLEFARVRLISRPLTDYLRYEMINYRIRSRLGEPIEFILPPSPVEDYFDFLLFDTRAALIHDYGKGPVGRQTGGWLTYVPGTLDSLAAIVDALRSGGQAIPVGKSSQRESCR